MEARSPSYQWQADKHTLLLPTPNLIPRSFSSQDSQKTSDSLDRRRKACSTKLSTRVHGDIAFIRNCTKNMLHTNEAHDKTFKEVIWASGGSTMNQGCVCRASRRHRHSGFTVQREGHGCHGLFGWQTSGSCPAHKGTYRKMATYHLSRYPGHRLRSISLSYT